MLTIPARLKSAAVDVALAVIVLEVASYAMLLDAEEAPIPPLAPKGRPATTVWAATFWTVGLVDLTDAFMTVPVGPVVVCWSGPVPVMTSAFTGSLREGSVGPPRTPIKDPTFAPAEPGHATVESAWPRVASSVDRA